MRTSDQKDSQKYLRQQTGEAEGRATPPPRLEHGRGAAVGADVGDAAADVGVPERPVRRQVEPQERKQARVNVVAAADGAAADEEVDEGNQLQHAGGVARPQRGQARLVPVGPQERAAVQRPQLDVVRELAADKVGRVRVVVEGGCVDDAEPLGAERAHAGVVCRRKVVLLERAARVEEVTERQKSVQNRMACM